MRKRVQGVVVMASTIWLASIGRPAAGSVHFEPGRVRVSGGSHPWNGLAPQCYASHSTMSSSPHRHRVLMGPVHRLLEPALMHAHD